MIELDKIYNEDCLQGMKRIADGAVDCIITDLPYEVLHKDNPNAQWDRKLPLDKMWQQFNRIIKNNGAILLFSQGMFTAELMMSNRKMWRYNLVWDKVRTTGFLNANRMPLRQHEDIAVFYKKLPKYNPQTKPGPLNHSRGFHNETNNCYGKYKSGKVYDYEKKSVKKVEPTRPGEKFPTSIISIEKINAPKVVHPVQKPVELLRYLIRTYTDENQVVLDNCMGSGTTAVAALMEKRHFIGFETNKEYFDIVKGRIDEVLRSPTLF